MLKKLLNGGLAVYECATALKARRMALACDGGTVLLYETQTFEKVGQIGF